MAHPHRSAARNSTKTKFKSMLGSANGAKHTNNDSVANPNAKVSSGIEDVKIMACAQPQRLDRARGGKVAKKGVTVNVIVPPAAPPPPPMAMKPPMGPPPGPPGGMMPPPGSPAGNGPVPPMPLPQKARGGGIGKYPLTGGAGTGLGRLQRSKKQRKP